MVKDCARWFRHIFLFKIKGYIYSFCEKEYVRQVQEKKNSASSRRCFIVATGPSLTVSDLELLKDEVTFGVNGIFLVYNRTEWRPTHYVCTDDGYFGKIFGEYELIVDELAEQQVWLNRKNRKLVSKGEKVNWLRFSRWNRATDFRYPRFADDISKGMYALGTVTNVAVAIAMYMGYKDIYIIGADCSDLKQHIVNDISNLEKDDEYLRNMQIAQLKGYRMMRRISEERGVRIFNATRGGALEEFVRVDLDDIIR